MDDYSILNVPKSVASEGNLLNVAIAAATTAYSRVEIFNRDYINLSDNKCLYVDTDGVGLEKELDPALVGKELGPLAET